MVKTFFILYTILFASLSVEAQDCFARISLDRRSVYVQQPFKVTITVLTATWYTAPLEFDNTQIPNAFVLPFDQTQPGMFDVGDDQYAGLTFYFIVFPYKEGSFTIPAINIVATTPPKGSSESRKITIQTKAQQFTVKPLPENLKEQNVIVAKNIFVREHWNKSLRDLKVGDIIERTITIDARGTLPQFIPPLSTDTLSFASVYPQEQELTDTRNEFDANGRSTQSTTYLLEKEGTFTIPAVAIHGWNPITRKQFTKRASAQTIHVQANSNLGILTTIRDSLTQQQPVKTVQAKTKGPLMIMGMHWYWFALICIGSAIVLYVLVQWLLRIYHFANRKYKAYKISERYWFRKFQHSAGTKAFYQNLYAWWDRFPRWPRFASITQQLKEEKAAPSWLHELDAYNKNAFADAQSTPPSLSTLKKEAAAWRREHLNIKTKSTESIRTQQLPWTH